MYYVSWYFLYICVVKEWWVFVVLNVIKFFVNVILWFLNIFDGFYDYNVEVEFRRVYVV